MTEAADLLERYLRQRGELGEAELILEQPGLVLNPIPVSESPGLEAPPAIAPSSSTAASRGFGTREKSSSPPPSRGVGPGVVRPAARTSSRPATSPDTAAIIRSDLPANHPLAVLNVAASGCTACGLSETRNTVVFGEGNPQARLVVVGEAPGADEDRTGRPFVGRAGRLLDSLLQSIGFPRESVYICNVLKCRPPGNRNPLPVEVEACAHFLRGQLEAISPRAILTVGTFASQSLLQSTVPIGRLRGTVHSFEGTPLVPTYHPAALLRNPGWIRPVWEDLQELRRVLDAE